MGHYEDRLLWDAIGHRDRAAIRKALGRGASANARAAKTLYGRDTVLVEAARLADEVAVEELLAHGAAQRAGRHQETPLIALVRDLADHQAHPGRVHRCLELLLAKNPSLEPVGGDSSRTRANVMVHALHQCQSPARDLALDVVERLVRALGRRRKPPSDEFCASLLLATFCFHTPKLFDRLVEMGIRVDGLSAYAGGLAYRLATIDPPLDAKDQEAWWETLARHRVPQGKGGPGIDPHLDAAAQAELVRRQLENSLPSTPRDRPRSRL